MMKFELNAKEVKNLEAFIRKQRKLSGHRAMKFTFVVNSTGIGTVTEVENHTTGMTGNITDYDSW
jgi:hypothetical protein